MRTSLLLILLIQILYSAPQNKAAAHDLRDSLYRQRVQHQISDMVKLIKDQHQEITNLQDQLKTQESLIRDVEKKGGATDSLKGLFTYQDKRIGDISTHINGFGILIAVVSLLITILVATFAIITYRNARTDAQNASKDWLKNNADDLNKSIEEQREVQSTVEANFKKLEIDIEEQKGIQSSVVATFNKLQGDIKEHQKLQDLISARGRTLEAQMPDLEEEYADAKNFIDAIKDKLDKDYSDASLIMQKKMEIIRDDTTDDSEKQLTPDQKIAVETMAKKIEKKPERERTVEEWKSLAFEEFENNNFAKAITLFRSAIEATNITDSYHAQCLYNIGIIHGRQNQNEEQISIYYELVSKYNSHKSPHIQEFVAIAMFNIGAILSDRLNRPEEAIAVYNEMICKFNGSTTLPLLEQVAKVMFNKGTLLGQLDELDEAMFVFDELIAKFHHDATTSFQEYVAKAMINKGITLSKLERFKETVQTYDELIVKFQNREDIAFQREVITAMLNKGNTLDALQRPKEAITVYDQLIAKYQDPIVLAFQDQVVTSMLKKGIILGKLDRLEEAILVFDELIVKHQYNDNLSIQGLVAKAMFSKALILGKLDHSEEAILIYDELIVKFHDNEVIYIQELVASSMLNKGIALGDLDRLKSAILVYEELIIKFKEHGTLSIQEQVVSALSNKGFNRLILGKKSWDTPDSKKILNEALSNSNEALNKCSKDSQALILGNIAYTTFLLGNRQDSKSMLWKAFSSGGEKTYKDTLEDINKHPIPDVDDEFERIVEKVWKTVQEESAK